MNTNIALITGGSRGLGKDMALILPYLVKKLLNEFMTYKVNTATIKIVSKRNK